MFPIFDREDFEKSTLLRKLLSFTFILAFIMSRPPLHFTMYWSQIDLQSSKSCLDKLSFVKIALLRSLYKTSKEVSHTRISFHNFHAVSKKISTFTKNIRFLYQIKELSYDDARTTWSLSTHSIAANLVLIF